MSHCTFNNNKKLDLKLTNLKKKIVPKAYIYLKVRFSFQKHF